MTAFWFLFWLGFSGFYLAHYLITNDVFVNDGSSVSGTHIWVHKGSSSKVRDASEREVHRHKYPTLDWDKGEKRKSLVYSILLVVLILGTLIWLAFKFVFTLPEEWVSILLFVVAALTGAALARLMIFLHDRKVGYQNSNWALYHLIAAILMGLGVVLGLGLTIFKVVIPDSHYYLLAIAASLIWVTWMGGVTEEQKEAAEEQRRQPYDSGVQLNDWVIEVMGLVSDLDIDNLARIMNDAVMKLGRGELDNAIKDERFFNMTEAILLDLVRGNQMVIDVPEVYNARDEILGAVQAFYFYTVKKFPEFEMHPIIKAKMNQ